MPTITKPDIQWLHKLLHIVEEIYDDYPELFSTEDEEVIQIAGQLIREKNYE